MGGASRHRPITALGHTASHSLRSCLKLAPRLLLRSRLTTPHPFGAKATLLAKLTYSRRQFSPSGQRIRAVHTHLPPANACTLIGAGGRQNLPMYDVAKPRTRLHKIRNLSDQQPSMISPTPFSKASHSPRRRRANSPNRTLLI